MAQKMRSLQSPLAHVRGLGSAKDGTTHWWHQRLTAIALVPLVFAFAVVILRLAGAEHAQAVAVLRHPLIVGLGTLLIVAAFWHLKLGLQVVIEDYVHAPAAKLVALLGVTYGTAILGLASLLALFRIAFGG